MRPATVLSTAAFCAILAADAWAQTESDDDTTKLAEEIIDCAGLNDKDKRLACFDEVAEPLLGLAAETEGSADASALHKFTGKDNWDSNVLELTTPWRLVWQNNGSFLAVELHTPQGEMVDVVGNQIGEGGGRSKVLNPGSYRLAVRGLGGWRLRVVSESDRDEGGN